MYSEYCSNQVAAARLLDKLLEENIAFFNFHDVILIFFSNSHNFLFIFLENYLHQVAQFDNPLCRKLDLASFLIIPMQRVCKYPLLLKVSFFSTPPLSNLNLHLNSFFSTSTFRDCWNTHQTGIQIMKV
jgi:hypothetical protein